MRSNRHESILVNHVAETDKSAAERQCKAERGQSRATREAFKAKYDSFNRCERHNAAEEETEREAAHKNAAKQCKAERSDPGFAAVHESKIFEQFYGTNKNGKNVYGKCARRRSRSKGQARRRGPTRDPRVQERRKRVRRRTGRDRSRGVRRGVRHQHNKRNACGKCVALKTQEPGH